MNDLERDLRDLLDADAAEVRRGDRPPGDLVRRVRRRQAGALAAMGGIVAAIVVGAIALATVLPSGSDREPTFAGRATTTGSINGVTITYREDWSLIDPDVEGLNGPTGVGAANELPRLILFLSSAPADETIACPGIDGSTPRWFVISVQEEPLALTGEAATPWPVDPSPQGTLEGSGCYPGWEFFQARWTAAGRSFDGRIGIAPDVADGDREAVLDAFASMTFAETGTASSAVIATGTAGGEEWELIASNQGDGLDLSLQAGTFGTGGGGFDDSSDDLQVINHVFGDGPEAERVVFGAVPANVVHVTVRDGGGEGEYDVIDVPDGIDATFDAFVVTVPAEDTTAILATDADGELVGMARIGGGPSEPPVVAEPIDTLPDGRHFGFIRSVDAGARTVEFDLAIWLSGDEANAAWQAAGNTGSVPNDYFVVNDNPKLRTLGLSPDLRLRLLDWGHCCDTFFDGDLATFAHAIAEQRDVEAGGVVYRGQSSWWLTVRDGVVTSIEEQYTP